MQGDKIGGPIRWRMHLSVPRESVFRALNSDDGRASFWAESAVESDDCIDFRFVGGSSCKSRILSRKPPEIFEIEYFGGSVRFLLTSDDADTTDLLLTHEGLSGDEWIETHAGWVSVLFALKAWLVHGIDLRNHDTERTWENGYADQ